MNNFCRIIIFLTSFSCFTVIKSFVRFGSSEIQSKDRKLHSTTHNIIQKKTIRLPRDRPNLAIGELIEFDLFDGVIAVGDVTDFVSRGPEISSWNGRIRLLPKNGIADVSIDDGYFGISCVNLACSAHLYIESIKSEFKIEPEGSLLSDDGDGLYVLSQINLDDEKKSGTKRGSNFFNTSNISSILSSNDEIEMMNTANVDMDLTLDLVVMYTFEALATIGGSVSAMKSLIYLANDQANTILSNSQVSLRLRVVDIESVESTFTEPQKDLDSSFSSLLSWLTTANDGYLDDAQTYRTTYAADLVLLVNDANAYCGLAWVNTGYSDTLAYANYNVGCMYGSVFMHEIGHVLGCYHDRISDSTDSAAYPTYLGFGHCWENAYKTDCTCYKSVMVYDCNTVPNSCTSCSVNNYLANYNVMNSGNPTGTTISSCGLLIHNNRYRAIKYRKSVQPGGMIFSVTPSYAINSTCQIVNITGWQFSITGVDVINVTLSGVSVTILSQTANSVLVRTSPIRNPSGIAGDVVVTSSTGRVTTSKSAFTFKSNIINDIETFTAKSLASTSWRSNGSLPWSFSTDNGHIALYKDAGSYTEYEAAELLSYTLPGCTDTFSYLSFQYWAYSTYTFCYGPFTVASRTSVTKGWTTLWTASGYATADGLTPWINVSMTLPTGTVGIRLRIKTADSSACRWWSDVEIDNLTVKKVSTCASGCSNVITTSSACTPITSSYLEQFSARNLALTKWVSNGTLPWTFYTGTNNNAAVYKDASTGSTESLYSALIHNVVGSISSSGCNDTATFLSFRYWSYSSYGFCNLFSLSTRSSNRDPWLMVWSGEGITTTTGSSTPWLNVSMDLPVGTKGIKFIASTATNTNCRYFAPFRLDDIAVTYNTYCKGSVLCASTLPTTTSRPTILPTSQPTGIPIIAPSVVPVVTSSPTVSPSSPPTTLPSTKIPTSLPTVSPTNLPTSRPTALPTSSPTNTPTKIPTTKPTNVPTITPTTLPSSTPTVLPTVKPSASPSSLPTTNIPTRLPTTTPTRTPTKIPSNSPSQRPTTTPTMTPILSTSNPSFGPTIVPTTGPTNVPTVAPSTSPITGSPSVSPTVLPSIIPSIRPTNIPSMTPTISPTLIPNTFSPTNTPIISPTQLPTSSPSSLPTSNIPTRLPTTSPSSTPTLSPSTAVPSHVPSLTPTAIPTSIPITAQPTSSPTVLPSAAPVIFTSNPTFDPTKSPTVKPSASPSSLPTSNIPTRLPTTTPTITPTKRPTVNPSQLPTRNPSTTPSTLPTTYTPTKRPTSTPTVFPSARPSATPSSRTPSIVPTTKPSALPTTKPTIIPTSLPTVAPTNTPSARPTSGTPTIRPSVRPSLTPTLAPTSTSRPSVEPTVAAPDSPTNYPTTAIPSSRPSTVIPSSIPTKTPTTRPTSYSPTPPPTRNPTTTPTRRPTSKPSTFPTRIPKARRVPTIFPSTKPTMTPILSTSNPSFGPTIVPTTGPTNVPTVGPSTSPITGSPSVSPTVLPSIIPSIKPTDIPSMTPAISPTLIPNTFSPTNTPIISPTVNPTSLPSSLPTSNIPTRLPTTSPSTTPTLSPSTTVPSHVPSITAQPTSSPTVLPSSPTRRPTSKPSTFPTRIPKAKRVPTIFPSKRAVLKSPPKL